MVTHTIAESGAEVIKTPDARVTVTRKAGVTTVQVQSLRAGARGRMCRGGLKPFSEAVLICGDPEHQDLLDGESVAQRLALLHTLGIVDDFPSEPEVMDVVYIRARHVLLSSKGRWLAACATQRDALDTAFSRGHSVKGFQAP